MNRDKTILLIFLFVGMLTMFGIPLWISAILVAIVAVIFLIDPTILKNSETSYLKSKLPSGIKTILIVMIVIAVIFFGAQQLSKSANYIEIRLPEGFDNNETNKDYGYSRINGGDFAIADGKLMVLKAVRITNTGLLYENPIFKFSIGGLEYGEIIKVDVLLESRTGLCPFNFTMNGPSIGEKRVEIGVGENDRVWVKIDNSQIDIPERCFDSSVSYDLTVDITSNKAEDPKDRQNPCRFKPSFSIDRINFG
ncbi:MAG: hypothetical protein C5S44_08520 [Candidatus Methanocomedens sp.]|nr:MAG: hypothetical protein C5S44_08520 [ANME-2 cluster archaeon]